MLFFHQAQGFLPAGAGVGPDAGLLQQGLRMLRLDRFVVHHQHIQGPEIDRRLRFLLMIADLQRHRHRHGRADALLRFNADRPVQDLDNPLRNRHTQAGPTVFVLVGVVLLGERVKNPRNVVFIHADARIPDNKAQRGLILEHRRQRHAAGRVGKLDCVGQDVVQYFPDLRIIADKVFRRLVQDFALIGQAPVAAHGNSPGADRLHQRVQGEFLLPQRNVTALDSAHVQDVVDHAQQVPRADPDLLQILPGCTIEVVLFQCQRIQPDDRVHGRADLVTHG